jgi:hypothetical protein
MADVPAVRGAVIPDRWPPRQKAVHFDGVVHEVWVWGTSNEAEPKGTTVCCVLFALRNVTVTTEAPTCLECVGTP